VAIAILTTMRAGELEFIRKSFTTLSSVLLARGDARRQQYRLYHLDACGRVLQSDTIEVHDDLDALEEAEAAGAGNSIELWQDARLVAKIDRECVPSTGNTVSRSKK
jgi:hypothetical protein